MSFCCDCNDCSSREFACHFDCDMDNMCIGCAVAKENELDGDFEADKAQGKL